jgi:8-oxo-dGTP pyrophosphatase MutT (NUDIX family)
VEKLSAETVFEGATIAVSHGRFRRTSGEEVEREVVEHPGSVGILVHDDEAVYLVSQPREAVGQDGSLEIPAGIRDHDGESELDCAKRELSEETGLGAERWVELRTVYPSPGFLDERVTLFEATGLAEAAAEPDEDEQIEIVRLPLGEIEQALPRVTDAKTLVALLLLLQRQSTAPSVSLGR